MDSTVNASILSVRTAVSYVGATQAAKLIPVDFYDTQLPGHEGR